MTEPDDRELLRRYRAGDPRAFAVLLERHEGELLRFAARYARAGARDIAQDIVQETFLRLIRACAPGGAVPEGGHSSDGHSSDDHPSDGREIENLSAWLYRVTRNLAIDEARKEQRMENRQHQAAVSEVHRDPTPSVERDELALVVEAKLDGLPTRQRDVLILKIQEEKSYREISTITGLSVSNVGYLIHQGLKTLASELRTAGIV